jgi:hypothetical protein
MYTSNNNTTRHVRIHSTVEVIRESLFIVWPVLEVTERVPPTCTTKTSRTHFQGLVEIRLAQTHVVGTQVLHPRAQHRNVASGKQPLRGTVGRHGLVRFVLGREGVAKTNPSRCKRFFFRRGFRKIPAGQFKFPNRVVVTPHRIP